MMAAESARAETPPMVASAEALDELKFHKGSARMFESNFFEAFSRVHPAIPAAVYGPLVILFTTLAWRAHASSPVGVGLRIFGGYFAWTITEYWLHRLLFHVKVVGPKTKRLYFFVHGVHHDWPWDMSRLVIPPGASVFLCAAFVGLFAALFGVPGLYPWFAGFLTGYVLYDTVHWYVHARTPRSRLGKWLRREHMVHHFKAPDTRFGVSCPWLDHVFRTTGAAKR